VSVFAKLEVQIGHLTVKLDDTHRKVEEMYSILLQAKGARWVIIGLAGLGVSRSQARVDWVRPEQADSAARSRTCDFPQRPGGAVGNHGRIRRADPN
jgi:hypothetical protein